MYSSPLVSAPKLQIAVEQPLIGGCWNLPQKEIPRPKTKKLQQVGRRDAITIKLNLIPARWVTHRLENNNTKKVLALLWRFWIPCQASQPGDLTKGLGIPRESGLEGQRDSIIAFPEDWGKTDSSLWGHKQNFEHTKTQRRAAVTPPETEPKLVLEGLLGRCGSEGLTAGMGALEGPPWRKASWSSPLILP